jgi:cytochrome c-type biogenesis protein CcmH
MSKTQSLKIAILGICLSALIAFVLHTQAHAVFVEERLDDPKLEERARDIADGIRCLVCQNQSIMDSNADLAKDLRAIVRERVAAGDSDADVQQYLVSRYGDWVLLNPPFRMQTFLLWVFPFAALAIGAIFMVRFLRRKSDRRVGAHVPDALSAEEAEELQRLLNPDDAKVQK